MMNLVSQLLLIFCAMVPIGFTSNHLSSLLDCLSRCENDTCVDDCNDFQNVFPYPETDDDTVAEINLHCVTEDTIVIKFNPGIYILEQRCNESEWNFVKATKGSRAIFRNLTAGSAYRYRLFHLTNDGVSRPETSETFLTYQVDYEPLPIKNITITALTTDEIRQCNLRAEVEFEPAEDRSCNYNVVTWNGEHKVRNFNLERVSEFRFELNHLQFEQSINLSMSPVNRYDATTGPITWIIFETLGCLDYYNDLTICAPAKVKGLRANHIHRDEDLYDLVISWNRSSLEPYNYTIEIDLQGDQSNFALASVPGNTTEVSIPKLNLGPQYAVSIIADSLGGTSIPETIIKSLTIEPTSTATINEFYRDVVIGIALLVTIIVVGGMIFLQYCKQKSKKYSPIRTCFEGSNRKEQFIVNTKKLFTHDSEFDVNNSTSLTITHDKYDLSPKLLKIKGILGAGAYGVVRLGNLRDKFNNVTDVAVKMLKDDPSNEDLQNFQKEILIMKFVGQHPNIVSLIGCCNLQNKPVLVVEFCCKGDLQTYLRMIWQNMVSTAFNHRVRLKFDKSSTIVSDMECLPNDLGEKQATYQNVHVTSNRLYDVHEEMSQYTEIVTANDLLNFARQIATGMEFLSCNRIVHRDLAARNILVCADKVVKISDFGLSRDIYQENLYRKKGHGKLPLKWMAIEALTHQIYTSHSDVWSFGILLWELMTMGAIPYPGIPTSAVLKLLKSGYRMEKPFNCSIELYDIMFSCWNVRPQSRPTFTELRESLDKLLSCHSDNQYLSIAEMSEMQELNEFSEI